MQVIVYPSHLTKNIKGFLGQGLFKFQKNVIMSTFEALLTGV